MVVSRACKLVGRHGLRLKLDQHALGNVLGQCSTLCLLGNDRNDTRVRFDSMQCQSQVEQGPIVCGSTMNDTDARTTIQLLLWRQHGRIGEGTGHAGRKGTEGITCKTTPVGISGDAQCLGTGNGGIDGSLFSQRYQVSSSHVDDQGTEDQKYQE